MKTAAQQGIAQQTRSVVLGTAGHIDHGKTALVFALTGTDTDRLPEEKSRGITIDLGFASMVLEDSRGQKVDLSLIDVPGHHAFVRNMLAGAGGIDCVMLVIAADEGVKAQTEEHLAICSLLGIGRGVVALTKMDAVSAERLQQAREEVSRFVQHTFLQDAPMVAVSALTREGIPELKAELARLVSVVPQRSQEFVTRLPLDRAFSVKGFGTVVTGTLQAGTVRAGDALQLQPSARAVRVRGVQVHGRSRQEARAPGRVALNLAGVEVQQVRRGDLLVPQETLAPVSTFDAEIAVLPGASLRHRSKVRVHAFTSDAPATLLMYERPEAPGDGGALVRVRLTKPMVLAPGDRFVIRRLSPATTIGGGRVLDAHPLPRVRKAAARQWLEQMEDAGAVQQILLRVARRGVAGVSLGELIAETAMTREALAERIALLLADGRLVSATANGPVWDHVIAREGLREAAGLIVKELNRAKDGAGSRAELQSKARLKEWVFELAVRMLQRQGQVEVARDLLVLPGRRSANTPSQDQRVAAVDGAYASAGLASPLVSEVSEKLRMDSKETHAVITTLLRTGRLVRLGADNLLIHTDAVGRLVADLKKHRGERFDVARFKSFTGLTRKHAIPLLEYLDGARVTRNSNGTRTVL